MSRNLVLIASYPKSGNTWVRLVLEKLLYGGRDTFSINDLSHGFQGYPRRLMFDSIAPADAADLLPEELDEFLPLVYRQLNDEMLQRTLTKVHDCARRSARSGDWILPPDCVQSVIYLVRHPFDVAVSYARFSDITVQAAVEVMSTARDAWPAQTDRLSTALQPHIGSWSGNVRSWTEASPYNVVAIRYEDLHANPQTIFPQLIAAAGFAFAAADVAAAIEETSFDRLQAEEREHGFRERPPGARAFFRAGRPQAWREEGDLNDVLREALVRDHREVMQKFGYRADGGIDPL
ncbi:MAG TPA: sulfotransferase domain-containing protein [Rhizomicrobium sp.]|jgi:hypothetical protein|nr:sulfotransferase domain-containing protein [Rhizomicrobium sp.]